MKRLVNKMVNQQLSKQKHFLHSHTKKCVLFFTLLIIDDDIKAHTADSVPMSKIEAELEAELARLELNITSNHLEEQPFDLSEVTIPYRNVMLTS